MVTTFAADSTQQTGIIDLTGDPDVCYPAGTNLSLEVAAVFSMVAPGQYKYFNTWILDHPYAGSVAGALFASNTFSPGSSDSTCGCDVISATAGNIFGFIGLTLAVPTSKLYLVIKPVVTGIVWYWDGTQHMAIHVAPDQPSGPCVPMSAPVADFSGTPVNGARPLPVTFTDDSTNLPTSWLWDFGDGTSSTLQNPVHTYLESGVYTVTLTATNSVGSDSETKVDYIRVYQAIEFDVYRINAPGDTIEYLATLDDATERSIRPVRNAPGSGQFTINRYSPNATAEILKPGNLVRVRIPEIHSDYIFAFFMETSEVKLVSSDEQGGEVITIGGDGALAYWDRAIWLSEKFVVPWWDTDWGTPPSGSIGHVIVQPGTYYRFTVVGNAITGLSKFTTKTGFMAYYDERRYCTRAGHSKLTVAHLTTTEDIHVEWGSGVDAGVLAGYPDASPVARVIRQFGGDYATVVDNSDLENALTRAHVGYGGVVNVGDVDNFMALGASLVSRVGYWIHPFGSNISDVRATYAIGTTVLLSDISPDTPGVVLERLYQEGVDAARPVQPIPLMTIDFTDTTDSNGDPWTTTDALAGVTAQLGEAYLDTIAHLVATGAIDVEMGPDLVMHAWNAQGRDLTGTTFGAGKVRFVKGVNIADELRRELSDMPVATFIEVVGADNAIGQAVLPDAASRVAREAAATGDSPDTAVLEAMGLADLNARLVKSDAIGFRIATGDDDAAGLYLPGPDGSDNGDFWLGDTVTVHTGTGEQDFDNEDERVSAITITTDDGANLEVTPEVGSVLGEAERALYGGSRTVVATFVERSQFSDTEIVATPATALDDLTDVDTTTTPPTGGQGLLFDGTDTWLPGDVATDAELAAAVAAVAGVPTSPITMRYTFSTTTTDADPGAGNLRLSNATQYLAVTIRADLTDSDGADVTALLDAIATAGTGYIRLQKRDDPTKWLVATLSASASPSGYRNLTIANIAKSANSPFVNGDLLLLSFIPTGGGSSGVTVSDEGTPLSTTGTTLDFVGAGVVASGTGATKTITVAGGGGALVLLEQHTASASASLDFTTFISSLYDTYLIEGVELALATNTASLLCEMGTGGGPTYDTGNNYEWARIGFTTGGGANNDAGFSGIARVFNSMSNNAGYGFGSFSATATGLQSTVHRKTLQGTFQYVDSVPVSIVGTWMMQWTTTGTAVTALRFIASSGNIASGTIRIYGVAK